MFKDLLPVYSLEAACGKFGEGQEVECEGWTEVKGRRLDERMFIARAIGRSMEPTIHDGDYCIFRANPEGTRQGKIVLVQHRGVEDPETGGSYTIKKYSSEKMASADEGWGHSRITLSPLNPDYQPIEITGYLGGLRGFSSYRGIGRSPCTSRIRSGHHQWGDPENCLFVRQGGYRKGDANHGVSIPMQSGYYSEAGSCSRGG